MAEPRTQEHAHTGTSSKPSAPHEPAQDVPQFWIPSHVRACPSASGAVILDLKRNRYYGVGAKEAYTLFTFGQHPPAPSSALPWFEPPPLETRVRIAQHLTEAGFLSRSPPEPAFVDGHIELSGTLTSVGHEVAGFTRIHPGHFVRFLRACAWSRRALRSRTLFSVASEISETKHRSSATFDQQRAIALVCVFRRLRPFAFAAKDQCLFHALALVKFLSCYQVFPTWVIGVRARPWAAHSWIQEGSLVLDSNPEHICEYTPILTV